MLCRPLVIQVLSFYCYYLLRGVVYGCDIIGAIYVCCCDVIYTVDGFVTPLLYYLGDMFFYIILYRCFISAMF